MSEEKNNRLSDSEYSVYAVIFGADDSILNISLKDGFRFERKSLNPNVSSLDKVFDVTGFGLRREYEAARIDEDSLDVICAVKENFYMQESSSLRERFEADVDRDLVSLDNQIRILRLIKEGAVRFIRIAFRQDTEYHVEDFTLHGNHNDIVPIGEAMVTKRISQFHCDECEVAYINRQIQELCLPLSDSLLNSVHVYYDLSYHTEHCVSVTLLMTALEMLFLERNEGRKENKLSKRCAVYLFKDNIPLMQTVNNNLLSLYDKRSDFVHEGNAANITDSDIITLREYVRKSMLKALAQTESKQQRIDRLKNYISINRSIW